MLIVDDLICDFEVQNSNASTVPLLNDVSKCNVG